MANLEMLSSHSLSSRAPQTPLWPRAEYIHIYIHQSAKFDWKKSPANLLFIIGFSLEALGITELLNTASFETCSS